MLARISGQATLCVFTTDASNRLPLFELRTAFAVDPNCRPATLVSQTVAALPAGRSTRVTRSRVFGDKTERWLCAL
jgi:hypothetical protein